MKKIKVAISGYGNIGKYTLEAIQACEDMELMGIIRRNNTSDTSSLAGIPVVQDIEKLGKVEVVILCNPSRNIPELAEYYAKKGFHTVDSYDIHGDSLWNYRKRMDEVCKEYNTASILAAGWDPGTNSVIRSLFLAMAPKGITYTNFGPGMSMGHSVAAKGVKGVKEALSLTIPAGNGIHHRRVYIELEDGFSFSEVAETIQSDSYFIKDQTVVIQTDSIHTLMDMGHATHIQRKGVSGKTQNQQFDFRMSINNPALTSQIMVSCARAVVKQIKGSYTLCEIPPLDLLPGSKEDLIKKMI